MIYNLIFYFKKKYNLFAMENSNFEKNAQNRQIEKTLMVRNN